MGNLTDFIKTAEEMLDCHNKENPLLGIMAAIALLKECARKDYEGMREFQAKFIEADQERIRLTSHLASARAESWIDPKTELPQIAQNCIVMDWAGGVKGACFNKNQFLYTENNNDGEGNYICGMDIKECQWWMPLPSSPDALVTQEGDREVSGDG